MMQSDSFSLRVIITSAITSIVMANQRDPDKRLLAAWVSSKLKKRVEDAASAAGQNVSDFVGQKITESLDQLDQAKFKKKKV